jgi:SAM-dependent methyltransferase
MDIDVVKTHIRDIPFMGIIQRDQLRIKETEECFTPTEICIDIISQYENFDSDIFSNPVKTFLDPCCGDGQFLGEVLIRKFEAGATFEQALSTIYGVDLMQDNVDLCRERLLCGRDDLRHIVEQNIVCADGLRYHYRFDNTHPYDDELKAKEFDGRFDSFFE